MTDPHNHGYRYWTKIGSSITSCRHDGYQCEGNGGRYAVRCISTENSSAGSLPEGERCFDFSAGTITNYKKGAYPECGTNVTIPATINGQAVKTI